MGYYYKTPFIKKFRTKNYFYIYDVNTNEFLRVDEIIYDIIDKLGNNNIKSINREFAYKYKDYDIKEACEKILIKKRSSNYFSHHRPEISFGEISINDVREELSTKIEHLILELTERCNQRCKYCVFSGRYPLNRRHGKKDMSIYIAKKAVDYFDERAIKNEEYEKPCIGFYGGEPLLRFDIIMKIIEYLKYLNKFYKYQFIVTTNGTLLDEEKINYIIKNNIMISISLDGPRYMHDRYRVFKNELGTFDAIIANIKNIKKCSYEYFKKYISISSILAPRYDFNSLINFFYKNRDLKYINRRINYSYVDPYETSFFNDFNLVNDEKNKYEEIEKLVDNFKRALIEGNYDKLTIEKKLFTKRFYEIDYRSMSRLGRLCAPQGACIPGQKRLFVDVNGKFFMCEKVGNNFEIGDIYDGLDFKKIYEFLKKYEEFFKGCKDCWALRLCMKCFNNIRKKELFNEQRKNEMCEKNLINIERNLIDYCEIRENNPNAFKPFDKIIVKRNIIKH